MSISMSISISISLYIYIYISLSYVYLCKSANRRVPFSERCICLQISGQHISGWQVFSFEALPSEETSFLSRLPGNLCDGNVDVSPVKTEVYRLDHIQKTIEKLEPWKMWGRELLFHTENMFLSFHGII